MSKRGLQKVISDPSSPDTLCVIKGSNARRRLATLALSRYTKVAATNNGMLLKLTTPSGRFLDMLEVPSDIPVEKLRSAILASSKRETVL